MQRIKILLVDDHAMFREGVRALLQGYEDIDVVGQANDGLEAIEMTRQLNPRVVLMDIAMPNMGGLEATRRICKENPEVKVLVLTQYEDREYVLSFLKAGATGYIAKSSSSSDLVNAIRAVSKGESYLFPSATATVIEEYLMRLGNEKTGYEGLSEREREVLQMFAEGLTNHEIADKLFISVKTVLRHRTSVMEKLGIRNRTELIKYAIAKGLIRLPPGIPDG